MNNNRVFFSERLIELFPLFHKALMEKLRGNGITFQSLEETNDIWCRDYLPIQLGTNQFIQFSLTKDYYYQKDHYKCTNPAPICKALGIDPIIPTYKNKPIYLDGGNLILSPGRTKAIITEKVFADNEIPRNILAGILKEVLQVEQVIFIPVETGDDTGHADGMVRFVDDRIVVANDYSMADYVTKSFRDRFYGALAGRGLDVLLVPYNPLDQRINGYWVAIGCYINFLQVDDKIFLPTFDDPLNDEAALKRFGEIFGVNNVIPVPSREVALGGGVLNCLTWLSEPRIN